MDASHRQAGRRDCGRLAEDFKLATAIWVRVATLRARLLQHRAPAVLAIPKPPRMSRCGNTGGEG
jgi:hypothetical protein